MISVDTKDWNAYVKALSWLDRKGFARVAALTLNAPAAAIAKRAVQNTKAKFVVRTQFTIKSIRQDRFARGDNIDRMFSRVGSNNPYLYKHDEGETVAAKNKAIAIPFLTSRGGDFRSRIYRKYAMNRLGELPSARYFLGKPKGGNRPPGIWERVNKNRKLKPLRFTGVQFVQIKARNWYSEAEKRYATLPYIQKKFFEEADKIFSRLKV